jgi:hypothetical protein
MDRGLLEGAHGDPGSLWIILARRFCFVPPPFSESISYFLEYLHSFFSLSFVHVSFTVSIPIHVGMA